MKVGILTTSHAYNYGALLQAFSLQQIIQNEFGCECETIDFNPGVRKHENSIYYPNTKWRNIIRNILLFFNYKARAPKKKRIKKFDDFKKNSIKQSSIFYNCENLKQSLNDYDCIITGSDQVWNMSLFPASYYFLDFAINSNIKRFSYAASVLEPIAGDYKDIIKNSLSGYSGISVREREDVGVIQSMVQRKVERVIDPVFLNTSVFWTSKEREYKIPESYILCYFLGGDNAATPIINSLKQKTELKVASFNLSYKKQDFCDYDCTDADPFEFLYLINHATLICTNSFHCTAFSILFHKNFYLMAMNKKRNTRMLNLIEDYDIDDRILNSSIPKEIIPINYTSVDKKMEELRRLSLKFISESLK